MTKRPVKRTRFNHAIKVPPGTPKDPRSKSATPGKTKGRRPVRGPSLAKLRPNRWDVDPADTAELPIITSTRPRNPIK